MREIHPLINGLDSPGNETFTVFNPTDGTPLANVSIPTPESIQLALSSAESAFNTTRKRSAAERQQLLNDIHRLLKSRKEEAARCISLESAKPIRFARGEVDRALNTFAIASEEAGRMNGEILPLDTTPAAAGRSGFLKRFPVGPVLAITPFNFPLNLVAHKFAPALACGCPLLLKPASQTPLSGRLLCELAREAGTLPGEVQFLPLPGKAMTDVVLDPRIKKISFTGSADVGWKLAAQAVRSRVTLELGGNAAVIIEDVNDLMTAADKVARAAFAYSGQVCISVQRILIHRPLLNDFRQALITVTESLKTGDPLDENTEIGPMINPGEAVRVKQWIDHAVNAGATLLCGGMREQSIVYPTLLENVPVTDPIQCQEVFGPVACIQAYDNFDEALKITNDSRYGLQAGVFTQNLSKAFRAWDVLDVGGVIINDTPIFRVDSMPYGGVKDSGRGREGVRFAMEEMTEPRLLVLEG